MLSSKPLRFNWEDDCCVPLCVPLNFFFMWKTVFPLNRSLFAFCRCCIMQVFVCSGWAGNLRKWETLAPTPFCEFVHLRAEAENDPQKPAESLQTWHPGSRIFASQAHEVCAHVWVWDGICQLFLPPEPHCEGCWGQSTALSPRFWDSGCLCSTPGLEEEEDGALCPSPASLTAFTAELQCSTTALSSLCLPALTIQNNKYLCSLQAPKHANSYRWFVCSTEAPL